MTPGKERNMAAEFFLAKLPIGTAMTVLYMIEYKSLNASSSSAVAPQS